MIRVSRATPTQAVNSVGVDNRIGLPYEEVNKRIVVGSRASWGHSLWFFIHHIATVYDDMLALQVNRRPTDNVDVLPNRQYCADFILKMLTTLPCGECTKNFEKDVLNARSWLYNKSMSLFLATFNIHYRVTQKTKGYKTPQMMTFPLDEIEAAYRKMNIRNHVKHLLDTEYNLYKSKITIVFTDEGQLNRIKWDDICRTLNVECCNLFNLYYKHVGISDNPTVELFPVSQLPVDEPKEAVVDEQQSVDVAVLPTTDKPEEAVVDEQLGTVLLADEQQSVVVAVPPTTTDKSEEVVDVKPITVTVKSETRVEKRIAAARNKRNKKSDQ